MVQSPLWKTVGQVFKKFSIGSPYNPEIPLLAVYPRELKTRVHLKTCAHMFTAALFKIAKKWKQPKCPLNDD